MPGRSGTRNTPKDDKGILDRFGITPGAQLSKDPGAPPETEPCNIPGCNASHATHSVGHGD